MLFKGPYVAPVLWLDAANGNSYDGSNVWVDIGSSGKNATLTGSYSYANGAITFTSAGDGYAQGSTFGTLPVFTANAWFKVDALPVGTSPQIISDIFSGSYVNYALGFDGVWSNNNPQRLGGGTFINPWYGISDSNVVVTDTWYNYTVTSDGSALKLYLNGNIVATGSSVPAQSQELGYYVGRRWDDNLMETLDGKIGTVQVFDRALTSAEISNVYAYYNGVWT